MGVNLTSGAISKISTRKCTDDDNPKPVLQLIDTSSGPIGSLRGDEYYGAMLSDGSFTQFGVFSAEVFISKKLQKGSVVQLTKFQVPFKFCSATGAVINQIVVLGYDLTLIHSNCDIIGHPSRYPLNETLLFGRTTPTIPDEAHDSNSHHVEEPLTSKQKQDHVDSHRNENIDENTSTSTQKCSSHPLTQSKKRKVQPSNDAISVFGKGISETGINLTSGAITEIVTGKCTENDLKPVVQLIDVYSGSGPSKDDKQWYLVVLSDGSFWQFGRIADEIFLSKNLQIGSVVQLTKFQLTKSCRTGEIRYIFVCDLNVVCSKCDIIGDPTLVPRNGTPSMEKSIPPNSDHERVDPHLSDDGDGHHIEEAAAPIIQNKKRKLQSSDDKISAVAKYISKIVKTMKKNTEDDDVHACFKKLEIVEEDVARLTLMMMDKNKDVVVLKKLETLEEDVSKLTRMMMEKNKEDDMGACIEKLEKMGWGAQEPMYDTALLLFGQSADYRKLWLHLKPESCRNWVKNAGSVFGLLD